MPFIMSCNIRMSEFLTSISFNPDVENERMCMK